MTFKFERQSVLRAISIALGALSLFYLVLFVLLALIPSPARSFILPVASIATRLLPSQISGLFVILTPLGTALRCDYIIASVFLRICKAGIDSLAS